MNLARAKNFILDLLFPRLCLGCGREGEFFCSSCRSSLRFIPPACLRCGAMVPGKNRVPPGRSCRSCRKNSFIYAYLSPFRYTEEPIRSLIHGLKYHRLREIHVPLAEELADYCGYFNISFPENTLLTPVPLHPARQRLRGFNQAALLGEALAGLLKQQGQQIEYRPAVLRRVNNTAPQVDLSGEERRKNVADAFVVAAPELVNQKAVVVLDDVKTTGATLEEAARALKKAGAKTVWAITVAH